jgi:alkylation response protein AidB-like acyl-CoA dehydrogenase
MELDYTPEQRKFRDELRAYLADMMTDALTREVAGGFEGGGPEFRRAMQRIGKDGLIGLSWPKEYGGQERSAVEQFIFADEIQAIGFPFPFLTLNTIGPILRQYGSAEQRQYFLPKILAGDIFFSVGYSEPGAGTDLASL